MEKPVYNEEEVIKFEGDQFSIQQDSIATEFPLTIMVNKNEFSTIVCSPTHIRELIIGFLVAEGVVLVMNEIEEIIVDTYSGFAHVKINKKLEKEDFEHTKRMIGSCCGKSRQFYFKSDAKTAKTILSRTSISIKKCYQLMEEMHELSNDFHVTGGIHNAALATEDDIILFRSDIGRHNALDKIYGNIVENKIAVYDKVIVFSGRISSEVVLKVAKIGVGIIISKSASTDLAIQLARDLGITIVGFVRGNMTKVYSHPERIKEIK